MPFFSSRKKHRAENAPANGYASPGNSGTTVPAHAAVKPKSRKRKAVKAIVITLVCLLAAAGIAAAAYLNNLNSLLSDGVSSDEQDNIDSILQDTSFDEPFYVLLIGSDKRASNSSMGQRSDTNILVRIDIPNSTITMISIPRDTAITYGDYGTIKFNAAYAYDGTAGTISAANDLCGVKISHYVAIDFDGLTELVDSIGGVDVEVDERIDDSNAGDVVIEKGQQHLDGEEALVFARSRAYTDGDFTRVKNQRKLVKAICEKALSESFTDLANTVTTCASYVTTDMSAQDLAAIALKLKNAGDLKIYSATIPSTTGSLNGESYVFADVPGLQVLMEAVEDGKNPSSKKVQAAIEKAETSGTSSDGDTSSVGSNAVSQYGTSEESGTYDSSSYSSYGGGTGTYGYSSYPS
ncbi:MAG: LCP family protein [Eggerthellaceae bacterium]|jgi:LCP family protein required for cell wall assembly